MNIVTSIANDQLQQIVTALNKSDWLVSGLGTLAGVLVAYLLDLYQVWRREEKDKRVERKRQRKLVMYYLSTLNTNYNNATDALFSEYLPTYRQALAAFNEYVSMSDPTDKQVDDIIQKYPALRRKWAGDRYHPFRIEREDFFDLNTVAGHEIALKLNGYWASLDDLILERNEESLRFVKEATVEDIGDCYGFLQRSVAMSLSVLRNCNELDKQHHQLKDLLIECGKQVSEPVDTPIQVVNNETAIQLRNQVIVEIDTHPHGF